MTWKEHEQQITHNIEQAREAIQERKLDTMEYAYTMRLAHEDRHWTRHHPVWGQEMRHDIALERSAGIETGPPTKVEREERYYTMERWEHEVREARQPPRDLEKYDHSPELDR